jgi:small-conductance mechanosensitive channel
LTDRHQHDSRYDSYADNFGFFIPKRSHMLGFMQGLDLVVLLIASIWMLAAATIGVKQALSYQSTSRALGVSIIGWIISAAFQALLYVILFSSFGVGTS